MTAGAGTGWPRDNYFDPTSLRILQPPTDHVDHLHTYGFSAVANALPEDLAACAAEDLLSMHHGVWGGSESTAMRRREQRHLAWSLQEAPASVRAIIGHDAIADIAATAYGVETVRFTAWVIFYRPAGEAGTFWHADEGFIPIGGPILQFWLPIIATPTGRGLLFRSQQAGDDGVYTFDGMVPGALSYHAVGTQHAGQTYDQMSLALSFITHLDGARLESSEDPLHAHGRELFRARIFPDRAYDTLAVNDNTPLLRDLSRTSERTAN